MNKTQMLKALLWILLIAQVSGIHSWIWVKAGNPNLTAYQKAIMQGITLLGLLIVYK